MEGKVTKAKKDYSSALKRLEGISYEIHERRNQRKVREERGVGVGAESPAPSSPSLSTTLRKLNLSESSVITLRSPVDGQPVCDHQIPQSAPSSLPWTFYQTGPGSYSSSTRGTQSERDECESVTSDTVDTLDESAIEKLMLQSSIESEFRQIFVAGDDC